MAQSWQVESLPDLHNLGFGPLTARPLVKNPFATIQNSATRPSTSVNNLVAGPQGPAFLYECPFLVERCCRYYDSCDDGTNWQPQAPAPRLDRVYNMLDCPGSKKLSKNVWRVAADLARYNMYRPEKADPLVNIYSTQDAVKSQMIDLINIVLQVT